MASTPSRFRDDRSAGRGARRRGRSVGGCARLARPELHQSVGRPEAAIAVLVDQRSYAQPGEFEAGQRLTVDL